ncbi:MAG TPA: divalent metal cation transporter, partial [Longimicrobiales bacterium]
ISPYLFFWQAAEEMEEEKAAGRVTVAQRRGTSQRVLRMIRADTILGMTISQVIGYFIMICAAAVLYAHGKHDVQTAEQAALSLHPLGSGLGTILFCIGFIGTGIMAIPTLTGGASYVLAALFGWKTGIGEKPRRAPRFYIAMTAATLVAVGLDFTGLSAVKLLVGSAVLSGLLAPPLMVLILLITNDSKVMAGHTNGRLMNVLGVLATVIMGLAAIALVVQLVSGGA